MGVPVAVEEELEVDGVLAAGTVATLRDSTHEHRAVSAL
jgi:hypothetical protein